MASLEISGEIQNFTSPISVPAGVTFEISYDAVNITDTQKLFFGYILDNIQQIQIPGTFWDTQITPFGSYHFSINISIINPLDAQVVIGHITPEICDWIDSKGGPASLTIEHMFEMIDSYVFMTPPPGFIFIPTITEVFGVIDYFLGFDGGPGTGCIQEPGGEAWFGYDDISGISMVDLENYLLTSLYQTGSETGQIAQSITAYIDCTDSDKEMKAILYRLSDYTKIGETQAEIIPAGFEGWWTFEFVTKPPLTQNGQYWITLWSDSGDGVSRIGWIYDGVTLSAYDSEVYNAPNPVAPSNMDNFNYGTKGKYTIYCNYTFESG